jgi:hypothetical protein
LYTVVTMVTRKKPNCSFQRMLKDRNQLPIEYAP